ncbi:MAG TPA: hypothetical protein VHJ40_05275 [Actinomycetota bacterium]|nr:hypothetical protein [Actinomycetota bacterium]
MTEEPSLYERVWREAQPKRLESDFVAPRKAAAFAFTASRPNGHGQPMQESSISELIDQLEGWDTQEDARDFIEEFLRFAADLTNRLSEMHSDIERRLELQQVDLARRMEELEGSIRRRDLTFIESLVTVAELSWVRPEQDVLGSSLEPSAPPD